MEKVYMKQKVGLVQDERKTKMEKEKTSANISENEIYTTVEMDKLSENGCTKGLRNKTKEVEIMEASCNNILTKTVDDMKKVKDVVKKVCKRQDPDVGQVESDGKKKLNVNSGDYDEEGKITMYMGKSSENSQVKSSRQKVKLMKLSSVEITETVEYTKKGQQNARNIAAENIGTQTDKERDAFESDKIDLESEESEIYDERTDVLKKGEQGRKKIRRNNNAGDSADYESTSVMSDKSKDSVSDESRHVIKQESSHFIQEESAAIIYDESTDVSDYELEKVADLGTGELNHKSEYDEMPGRLHLKHEGMLHLRSGSKQLSFTNLDRSPIFEKPFFKNAFFSKFDEKVFYKKKRKIYKRCNEHTSFRKYKITPCKRSNKKTAFKKPLQGYRRIYCDESVYAESSNEDDMTSHREVTADETIGHGYLPEQEDEFFDDTLTGCSFYYDKDIVIKDVINRRPIRDESSDSEAASEKADEVSEVSVAGTSGKSDGSSIGKIFNIPLHGRNAIGDQIITKEEILSPKESNRKEVDGKANDEVCFLKKQLFQNTCETSNEDLDEAEDCENDVGGISGLLEGWEPIGTLEGYVANTINMGSTVQANEHFEQSPSLVHPTAEIGDVKDDCYLCVPCPLTPPLLIEKELCSKHYILRACYFAYKMVLSSADADKCRGLPIDDYNLLPVGIEPKNCRRIAAAMYKAKLISSPNLFQLPD